MTVSQKEQGEILLLIYQSLSEELKAEMRRDLGIAEAPAELSKTAGDDP